MQRVIRTQEPSINFLSFFYVMVELLFVFFKFQVLLEVVNLLQNITHHFRSLANIISMHSEMLIKLLFESFGIS